MQLGEQIWTTIATQTHKVVVVPLGSLEQHGHHLPLLTDSMIGSEIARRAEAELGDQALFLPMLWLGSSHHHRHYPGTVSLSRDVYVQVLVDILESLIDAGFRRIFLLNAHGGNIGPANAAMYDIQLRHRQNIPELWLTFASWFTLAAAQIAAIDELQQKHVTHACELETSMILTSQPALVNLPAARGANIPFASAFYCPDDSGPSRVSVPRMFEQLSQTGSLGHPEHATAAKGEALYASATREVVAFIREFALWQSVQPQ
jgi:creatinine amidohydrolase